jgi:hypothetical protein
MMASKKRLGMSSHEEILKTLQTVPVNYAASGFDEVVIPARVRVERALNFRFRWYGVLIAGHEALLAGFANGAKRIAHPHEPESAF